MFELFAPIRLTPKLCTQSTAVLRLCKGVLGSGENGVKKIREQGAWGKKDQGAGSKEKYFGEEGAEDSGHFIKQFHIINRIFLRLASLG